MSRYCKLAVYFLLVALCATNVFALSNSLDALVSDEEIVMPANLDERYAGADAIIILDKEEIDQSRTINPVYIIRHVAVKIMDAAGAAEYSTVKIPYYNEVKVNNLNAQIIRGGQTTKVGDMKDRDLDLEGTDKGFVYPIAMGSNVFFLRPVEKGFQRHQHRPAEAHLHRWFPQAGLQSMENPRDQFPRPAARRHYRVRVPARRQARADLPQV